MNNVNLIGRLTTTPELKKTQSGTELTSFTIAVDRKYKSNGEKVTDFIDCVAWKYNAIFLDRYFVKGQKIGIEGELQTRTYQDKNGNNRKAVEVVVNNIDFADSKPEKKEEPVGNVDTSEYEQIDLSGEDLPF